MVQLQTERRSFFSVLEGLRGLAAILVVMRHVPGISESPFPLSFLAVDLFFVLSGAVIANAYQTRVRTGEIGTLRFLAARIIRIFPLYLIFSLIGFLSANFLFVGYAGLLSSVILNPLLLPNLLGGMLFPFDYPAWSLFFEFMAYLTFIQLARASNLVLAGISMIAFSLLIVAANSTGKGLDLGWSPETFVGGLPRVLFGFTVGILLYRLRRSHIVFGWRMATALMACCAFFLAAPVYGQVLELWAGAVIVGIAFPAIVFLALHVELSGAWHEGMTLMGAISFPVYVSHVPIYMLLQGRVDLGAPTYLHGACYILFLAVFGLFVFEYIDKPIRSYLNRLISLAGNGSIGANKTA